MYPQAVQENYLVNISNNSQDRYRFGFNGQEKVNEISGIGNHNTAQFWEYDTRLARRWNLDPVDQIHAGQYEYYSSKGIKRSHLEDEVEAKVADIISGHQDDAVNGEYKSIKNYFKTGKKDKNFDSELNTLIKDVDKLYNDNDNTEGKQWRKNNDPKQVDKKNVLNYL